MVFATSPTSQKAGVRPISFVLDDRSSGRGPIWVPLVLRPEDFQRTEPARVSVHQTLGRDVIGWSDHFGAGLPSITLSGHTGWRKHSSYGDGEAEFTRLNELLARQYPDAKQRAIDQGRDPALVRLVFVDTLHDTVWAVEPGPFTLRRSKSRPLLFQYSILLNAIDTRALSPVPDLPFLGSMGAGLGALGSALSTLQRLAADVEGWVNDGLRFVSQGWAPIGGTVKAFMDVGNRVFGAVQRVAGAATGGISYVSNLLIDTAGDMAMIGVNVFRSMSSMNGVPYHLKHALGRVAAAYQEVFCIFKNSLRPRKVYNDYDRLFGASNCSSTTGGRPISAFASNNIYDLASSRTQPVSLTEGALQSMSALSSYDPLTNQATVADLDRNLNGIVQGFGGVNV